MKRATVFLGFALCLTTAAAAQLQPQPCDSRPADRDAIHAHIASIFQAFIDHDGPKLRATHAPEWRGYLEGSQKVIQSVDGYMKAVEGATHPGPNGMKAFQWVEFDCMFYGDTAIVPFVANVDGEYNGTAYHEQLRIVDFYAKLNGAWIQAGSDTQASPQELRARAASYQELQGPLKQMLLDTREKVWKAYFTNDRAYLEQVLPDELIALDEGDKYSTKQSVLEGAARFAQGGAKLTNITFTNTEIRSYGNVAEVYSTYDLALDTPNGPSHSTGRASETFVFRDGKWINAAWHLDTMKPQSGTAAASE